MKKFVFAFLILIFTVSTCTPTKTEFEVTPTITNLPTVTYTSTPNITPLPTIPTFTPTFDVATLVTVTPAEKEECPPTDLTIRPEDYLPPKIEIGFFNIADKVLYYLNKGGDGQSLMEYLDKISPETDSMGGYDFHDLTGDQVTEFIYIEFQTEGKPLVFSCKNEKFEKLAILSGGRDHLAYAMKINDLNMNGIPEIIIIGTSGGSYPVSTIYLYEWTGQTFSIMGQASILVLRQMQINDLNGNGIKEISFSGDNPACVSCSNFVPQRQRTITYEWNGKEFSETSNEFTPPKYRFQAVQDADKASRIGKYESAMQYYDAVINEKSLEWWSPERLIYEQYIANPVYMFIETPSAVPVEDLTEYPRLAAYVYYRILLLHFVQGQETEANATYQALESTFGNDPYAKPFIEMANAFLQAYQVNQRMYDGCAAAIQYAVEHPEILIPLGSDYHGWQSHIYEPADVCPFR